MLKIRLRRTGARKRPNYRVVVAESTAPRDGQFVEIIGFYDPLTEPATVRIDPDKARRWLGNGAQPSERVARLLAGEGLMAAPAFRPAPAAADEAEATPEPVAVAVAEPVPAAVAIADAEVIADAEAVADAEPIEEPPTELSPPADREA